MAATEVTIPLSKKPSLNVRWTLPILVLIGVLTLWALLSHFHVFPESEFPSPRAVLGGFAEEIHSGRMVKDIIASLFRISVAFTLSALLGIPFGLWLGQWASARTALLPHINFLRNLSPLAWIPFAILWFGIGDKPAIFLIFMATFFTLTLATTAAVATVPTVYFRVARDYGLRGRALLSQVTFPAILPQIITTLRVAAGIAWIVVVAAEMVGCQDGLGYAIYDGRNGLRMDLVAANMILIGLLGVCWDWLIAQLTRLPGVRWGYER